MIWRIMQIEEGGTRQSWKLEEGGLGAETTA